jgi:predicted RNA-binding Zn-ribbon protein involved in translation (DUF1610 family)
MRPIRLPCPSCGQVAEVAASDSSWTCPDCGSELELQWCRECAGAFQLPKGSPGKCPICGTSQKPSSNWRSTAADVAEELDLRAPHPKARTPGRNPSPWGDHSPEQLVAWMAAHPGQEAPVDMQPKDILSLRDGKLLFAQGFGASTPGNTKFRIAFNPMMLIIHRRGFWTGEKPVVGIGPPEAWLNVGTHAVTTGGGFIGGGFGLPGAAVGMLEAALLNAATTRTTEYAVLSIGQQEANGAQRLMVFGFTNIDESGLRGSLMKAVPVWVDAYIDFAVAFAKNAPVTAEEVEGTRREIQGMLDRGLMSKEQADRFYEGVSGIEAPAASSEVVASQGAPGQTSNADELRKFAKLRDDGIISAAEFEKKKQQLLGT